MELLPSDAETLRKMIAEEWFPYKERELEATFGVGGVVDSTRFLAVAQRLKSKGLKEVRQPDRLTISLEDNTRYTIQGEGTIAQYCQDNKIVGKSPIIMIKDKAGSINTLDLKDYDTRIKLRRELPLDANDPRVKSQYATWDQRIKFFRLIQRWSFVGKGVLFDLSMVRSTKKDERGLWKQVKKFHDADLHHDIFKEQPVYEIEVELDRGSEDVDSPPKALSCLVQGLGEVLRGIQRNPILIRNSIRDKVIEGYKELVGASDEIGKRGFRGVQPITLERDNMSTRIYYGSQNIRTGYNVTDKADGLRVMGYCDSKGELFMLDMSLNVYRTGLKKLQCANSLVDGEWVTKNKDDEPIQMFMLFDIYVKPGEGRNSLSPIYKQEFYHVEVSVSTRYKALVEWCANWRSEGGPISLVKGLTPQNSLKVIEKKFLFAAGTDSTLSPEIFTKCAQMLSRNVPYHTDGLILTNNRSPLPDRFGVRFNKQFKWKPSKDNTIDFLAKIVKDPQTNQDKLTDIIRPDSSDTIKYKTLRLYIGTSADPAYDDPRRTILLVKKLPSGRPGGRGAKKYRMRPVLFTPKEFEDSMASVCYLEAKEDMATGEWVTRCTTHHDAPGEASGDPITNNSIVEMRYDPDSTLASGWNWVPIRVRYDKTERFQSGTIERTLNSVETAESVWKSIHNPVTHAMITTGAEEPSVEEESQVQLAKERSVALNNRYYQKKSNIKNVSLVKSMASFHNLIIKGSILTEPILTRPGVIESSFRRVIDTSIGKGGDLGRYMSGVNLLVGIDVDADGIRDPDEGAYRRYLNRMVEDTTTRQVTPSMLFLIGDSSKSYVDGSSGMNEEEADMMRAVFGKVPPAAKVPPYVEGKFKGQFKEGADLITSMFSIHYYFETKEKWEGFLNNIRDNLKVGGYFTCCCFDGNIVTNLTRDLEKGEALEGTDADTKATIWKLTKENSLNDVMPSTVDDGFGHAIDVEFLSIGSSHREYLVSPQLLLEQMQSIGCDLANRDDCFKVGIPEASQSFETTYMSDPLNAARYPMTEAVRNFSFFNRWYVFRRYGTSPGVRTLAENAAVTASPAYGAVPGSPAYTPRSPAYGAVPVPGSPAYVPRSPNYGPGSPAYTPGTPAYGAVPVPVPVPVPGSPAFSPGTPAYGPGPGPDENGLSRSPAFSPGTPNYFGPGPGPDGNGVSGSPRFSPRTPNYFGPGSPSLEAALLSSRPASAAWGNVPLSGAVAQDAALRVMAPATPPYPPGGVDEEESPLPASPPFEVGVPPEESVRKWEEKKARMTAKAKSGLVTAVVEGGGGRTVAVERATVAGPQKKYKASEVLRFFGRAEIKDVLGIQDPGAARWLALSAPFPIKDGAIEYPTVNHYLAGMKYKLATDKPELAADLFSSKGTIHTKYLRHREQIATKHKGEKEQGQVKEHEDQELLRSESADVADAALPKTIKRYKAQFDEAKWIGSKDDVLKEALTQRWKHDARFRKIVEAARTKGKYLLYYTGSSTITSFGGVRRDDGRIEGENQVGKIIMELAGYPPL